MLSKGGSASVLTIGALLLLRAALGTGEQHLRGGAAVGQVHVQPGQGDGVLDDGRDGGRRRRRGVLGGVAPGSAVRGAPPDLAQRLGEEGADLIVGRGEGLGVAAIAVIGRRAAVVAEEGGVPEHVAAAAHVHGMAEVAQRRADHVQRQVAFVAPLAAGVRHQAFEARELLLKIHGHAAGGGLGGKISLKYSLGWSLIQIQTCLLRDLCQIELAFESSKKEAQSFKIRK